MMYLHAVLMLKPYLHKNRIEAGCDEVGRGCLSGPVYAAAVILPRGYKNKYLKDSKLLDAQVREELSYEIKTKAISWSIARLTPSEIDQINILQASFKAMHIAISKLSRKPEHLLVDGNRFTPYPGISHTCIIKGDNKLLPIAAASVLAKHARDEFMKKIHSLYPEYDWENNKGYPTKRHREAIHSFGPTPFHRFSYNLLGSDEKLDPFAVHSLINFPE
jgi:ribonuclease HII